MKFEDVINPLGGTMKTKIKSLTIINQKLTESFCVGSEYNGLILATIEDFSLEYQDSFHSIYIGLTAERQNVFEVINAPVEVKYCPV